MWPGTERNNPVGKYVVPVHNWNVNEKERTWEWEESVQRIERSLTVQRAVQTVQRATVAR